jgi:hypothetical protein
MADSATSWPVAGNRFRLTELDPSVTVNLPDVTKPPITEARGFRG